MRWTFLIRLFILCNEVTSIPTSNGRYVDNKRSRRAVKLLQEYIQIDTSKQENIECAVEFWRRQAAAIGLPFAVYRPSYKPICVVTWAGRDKTLPSFILNSHMDVVPAAQQNWTYPPFSGHIDQTGTMYGRGTQDTKALSITYLEAITTLIKAKVKLQRTVHLLLMPDEETGGLNGMIPFIDTEEFRALNPGFFLDEGITSPGDTLYASYQDKRPWQLNLTIYGEGGHGYMLVNGTAMEKVRRLLDITTTFRDQQKQIMSSRQPRDYGSYTSLNVDIIKGGIFTNVIPTRVTVVIDMRLAVSARVSDVEKMIQSWIAQVGNDTELSYIRKVEVAEATQLDDSNPYWAAVVEALREMDIEVSPIVFPATTDMVEIRNRGFPAIGLVYGPNTPVLIHNANEYINITTFLKGIDVYVNILKKVSNLL